LPRSPRPPRQPGRPLPLRPAGLSATDTVSSPGPLALHPSDGASGQGAPRLCPSPRSPPSRQVTARQPRPIRRPQQRRIRPAYLTITRPASADARRTWLLPGPPGHADTPAAPDTAGAPQRQAGKRMARAAAAAFTVAVLAAGGVTQRA